MAKRRVIEIGALGFLHGVKHIYESALSPLYLLLQKDFNISTLQLGLIGSVTSIANVLQVAAGYLVAKMGRKRLTVIGMLIFTAAFFAYGLSPSFLFLLVLVAVAGIGGSTFHPATYSMVAERAGKEHVTKSIAYHQFGGFLGGAIGVAISGSLALYFGWKGTVQILAMPGLIAVVLFWLIVKEGEVAESSVRGNQKTMLEAKNEDDFKITAPLLIIVLAAFISSFGGIGAMGGFIPMFLTREYGESIAWAGILTGIMQFVGCISLIIGGVVADKFDKVWIISIFMFLTGISNIVLATGHFSSEILLLVLVFRGFVLYFESPARHAITALISRSNPKGIGLEFTGIALGGMFAGPLTGYLIDTIGIRSAFLILSTFPFLSGATILLLKRWPSTDAIQKPRPKLL